MYHDINPINFKLFKKQILNIKKDVGNLFIKNLNFY